MIASDRLRECLVGIIIILYAHPKDLYEGAMMTGEEIGIIAGTGILIATTTTPGVTVAIVSPEEIIPLIVPSEVVAELRKVITTLNGHLSQAEQASEEEAAAMGLCPLIECAE